MSTPGDSATDRSRLILPDHLAPRARQRTLRRLAVLLVLGGVTVAALLLIGRAPRPVYRAEPVIRRTITRRIEALGQLDVPHRLEVSASLPGKIERVLVVPGHRVRAGETLARFDDTAANRAVAAARRSLAVARARVEEAQAASLGAGDARARAERLAAPGLVSEADLQSARTAAEKARAAVESARAELTVAAGGVTEAAEQARLMILRSPADGVVLAVPERPGAAVSVEGAPLFVLADTLDVMRVVASVAESDIAEVHPGQAAHFTVPAFTDRVFAAQVVRVHPDARRDHAAVTYQVTLDTANGERLLFPGMTANVSIDVASAPDVLAVREAALRFSPGEGETAPPRSLVWRLSGRNSIEPVSVNAGLSDGAYTELRPRDGQPLTVGEPIVIGLASPDATGHAAPGLSLGGR